MSGETKLIPQPVLDACLDTIETTLGCDFKHRNKVYRGLMDERPVAIESDTGGQFVSYDPRITVRASATTLEINDIIEVEDRRFRVKNKTTDNRGETMVYELKKV